LSCAALKMRDPGTPPERLRSANEPTQDYRINTLNGLEKTRTRTPVEAHETTRKSP
jgi:hypothetical protein